MSSNEIIQHNYDFYLVESPYSGYDLDSMSLINKEFPFQDTYILPLDFSVFRKGREKWRDEVFQGYFEFCLIGCSRHIVSSNIKNLLNFDYLEYIKKYNNKREYLQNTSNCAELIYRLDLLYRFNIDSICTFLGLSEYKLKKENCIVNGVINRLNLKIKHETSK